MVVAILLFFVGVSVLGVIFGVMVGVPMALAVAFAPDESWKEGYYCPKCKHVHNPLQSSPVCDKCGAYNTTKVSYRTVKGQIELHS